MTAAPSTSATASTPFGAPGPATRVCPQGGAPDGRGPISDTWRVSTSTDVHTLAGGLASQLRLGHRIHLRAIGAGAVNQAVKAVAIAGAGLLESDRLAVACVPQFVTVEAFGAERTAVDLTVFAAPVGAPMAADIERVV